MSINTIKDNVSEHDGTKASIQVDDDPKTDLCNNNCSIENSKKSVCRIKVSARKHNKKEKEISFSSDSSHKQTNDIQYHIFDYFKEHPSLFVTVASAFIAIISVFLNLTAFLNTNSYLTYFNVDNTIYKQSTQFIYFISIALAISTVAILFQSFISRTFESYLPIKKKFLLYKYSLQNIKDEQKKGKALRKKIRNKLLEYSETTSYDEKTKQVKENLDWLEEDAKRIKRDYKSTKRSIVKSRIVYGLLIMISCFFTWIVLSVICTLWLSITSYDWEKTLVVSTIISTVYILMCSIENWFLVCVMRINKKEIKADAQLDTERKFSKYSCCYEFPLSYLFDGNIKYIFNDSNCKKFVLSVVLGLVLLTFTCAWSGTQSALNKKDFFIVSVENETYVMIYNNGENALLEKAKVVNDSITIDTNQQKVISSKDIDMRKVMFNKVNVVREEHNVLNEQSLNNKTSENTSVHQEF